MLLAISVQPWSLTWCAPSELSSTRLWVGWLRIAWLICRIDHQQINPKWRILDHNTENIRTNCCSFSKGIIPLMLLLQCNNTFLFWCQIHSGYLLWISQFPFIHILLFSHNPYAVKPFIFHFCPAIWLGVSAYSIQFNSIKFLWQYNMEFTLFSWDMLLGFWWGGVGGFRRGDWALECQECISCVPSYHEEQWQSPICPGVYPVCGPKICISMYKITWQTI